MFQTNPRYLSYTFISCFSLYFGYFLRGWPYTCINCFLVLLIALVGNLVYPSKCVWVLNYLAEFITYNGSHLPSHWTTRSSLSAWSTYRWLSTDLNVASISYLILNSTRVNKTGINCWNVHAIDWSCWLQISQTSHNILSICIPPSLLFELPFRTSVIQDFDWVE